MVNGTHFLLLAGYAHRPDHAGPEITRHSTVLPPWTLPVHFASYGFAKVKAVSADRLPRN